MGSCSSKPGADIPSLSPKSNKTKSSGGEVAKSSKNAKSGKNKKKKRKQGERDDETANNGGDSWAQKHVLADAISKKPTRLNIKDRADTSSKPMLRAFTPPGGKRQRRTPNSDVGKGASANFTSNTPPGGALTKFSYQKLPGQSSTPSPQGGNRAKWKRKLEPMQPLKPLKPLKAIGSNSSEMKYDPFKKPSLSELTAKPK